MIELLKDVGIVIGVVVALLGLIGGLIALPKQIKEFRNWLRPLGGAIKGSGLLKNPFQQLLPLDLS